MSKEPDATPVQGEAGSGRPILANRYQLLSLLGKGGTGSVWRARDRLTGREIALKMLRAEFLQDARLRRRLRREARAVARLEHPNIVRLYDMGEDEDGNPFLAMERVQGRTLAEVAREPVNLDTIVRFIDQTLGALAYAHARGVVHRDLKPANIVITGSTDDRGEQVKLIDFGFARVEDDADVGLTSAAHDVFGTPTYMAPEQATGDFEVGPHTDVYAVGVVLWELLTGRPPFTGATGTAVVVQHVTAALPDFVLRSHLESLLPEGFEEVLRRALEKEPARRFDSAAAMRRALQAVMEEEEEEPTIVNAQPFDPVDLLATDSTLSGFLELTHAERLDSSVEISLSSLSMPSLQMVSLVPAEQAPLVGRDAIQRWIWDQVLDCCEHQVPHLVLLEGAVGMGKSRLCAWLQRTLAEGGWMTPLRGQFRAGERDAGLREALRSTLGLPQRPPLRPAEALAHALVDVDPAGQVDRETLGAYLWPDGAIAQWRVTRLVERLLRCLAARRPVYLWLDDLHHVGPDGLALIGHLAAQLRARPAPILIVATRRSEVDGFLPGRRIDPLAGFLDRHHEWLQLREVGRLDDEAVVGLLQHLLPLHADALATLVDAARGSPLYVLQAVQYLHEIGALQPLGERYRIREGAGRRLPRSLAELMRARVDEALADRSDGLRGLAERLALLGGTAPFGLVESVERHFGFELPQLEICLEGLVRLGVLVDVPGSDAFAFAHDLMRDALLAELAGRADAPELHRLVAGALAAWHADHLGLVAADVARHYSAAGRTYEAVEYLLLAGRTARARGRHADAGALYVEAERWIGGAAEDDLRAAALRADVRLGMAQVALDSGDVERARRFAERIEIWGRSAGDPIRTGGALRIIALVELARGRWLEAERRLVEARSLLAGEGDEAMVAEVDVALGRTAMRAGNLAEARVHFQRALQAFTQVGEQKGGAGCRWALGELAARDGDRAVALERLEAARVMAERAGEERLLAQISARLGELLRQAGQAEQAVRRYSEAAELHEALGDRASQATSLRGLGDALRSAQRPEAARAAYARAVRVLESLDDAFGLAVCCTHLGRLATDAADLEGAATYFERALAAMEAFDDPQRTGVLHAFLARVAHRRGDAEVRNQRLQLARRIDASRPLVVAEWPRILEELAEGFAAEGQSPMARNLVERAAEVWSVLGQADATRRCRTRLEAL